MEAMKETIAEADWLSNATRQEALEKVNSYYKIKGEILNNRLTSFNPYKPA